MEQDQWAITKNELGYLYIKDPENCEDFNFLKYISERENIFPNMLILSKK